ncbi:MAG: tRNA lysidine(34) synthetase TilS [Anaerolineales bacterium]|nr:tRNA lysidine(34) synthetase TilS [Anaerolineales bacterium]
MKQVVEKLLRDHCHLEFDRKILVGVSGGADSLCLLEILLQAGYPVIVAHVNHQLRLEAEAELEWVKCMAEKRGLPFVSQVVNVQAYSEAHGITLEEAARMLRYRFLFEQARLHNAQAVAVGHTADDQAETVMMNILRGSGLNGLIGMPMCWLPNAWSSEIPLVRPLLSSWRWETENYCRSHRLAYVQDISNQDTHYRRNLIRHQVIPYLEQINPQLKSALLRMADTLRADQQIVKPVVQKAWEECVLDQKPDWVVFDQSKLIAQPVEIKRQLMKRAMALKQDGLRDVDYQSVLQAVSCLEQPGRGKQYDLIGGMSLLVEDGRVWLAEWGVTLPGWDWPQITQTMLWRGEHSLLLPGGWILFAEWVEGEALVGVSENPDPFVAYLDLEDDEPILEIRARKPGDRYRPLGLLAGTMKVSDYMINKKIPRRARANWPLVCLPEQIVWIPGGPPAHPQRVQNKTQRALRLCLARRELV